MTPDNIKSPEGVSKEIDAALELLTQLRVGLVKEGCVELEQKAYDVHALLCKLHDTLATSLPKVEGVSDEEIDAMYPIEEDNIDGYYPSYELRKQVKAMRDKLQSHLSILSLENKELKDALAEEKAAHKKTIKMYQQLRDNGYDTDD